MQRLIDMHSGLRGGTTLFYCNPNEYLKSRRREWGLSAMSTSTRCQQMSVSASSRLSRLVSKARRAFYCSVYDNVPGIPGTRSPAAGTHSVSREGTHRHRLNVSECECALQFFLNPHCNFACLCFPSPPRSRWTPTGEPFG